MCSRLTCKADSTHKFIAMIAKRVLNIFVTKKKLYPSSKKVQIVGQYSQGTHPGLVLQYWTIARKVLFFLKYYVTVNQKFDPLDIKYHHFLKRIHLCEIWSKFVYEFFTLWKLDRTTVTLVTDVCYEATILVFFCCHYLVIFWKPGAQWCILLWK